MLKRRIKRGEASATSPKQRTGTPVSSPAPAELRPTVCLIWLSTGGTVATARRRLTAAISSAAASGRF